MFKLLAFFAVLAMAFAAPKPDPLTLTYSAGYPLAYSSLGAPLAYNNYGYNLPYAANYYNYYQSPLGYRNSYYYY